MPTDRSPQARTVAMLPPAVTPPLPALPPRPADAHKGTFGRALIVGGSRGMTGAVALAGKACLRGGAGLVRLAVPDVCQDSVAAFEPSYMTLGLPSDLEGRLTLSAFGKLQAAAANATALAVGPGLGRSAGLLELVATVCREITQPIVLDADALNAVAERVDMLRWSAGPRILTPHPGEFARLLNRPSIEIAERRALAEQFAAEFGVVLVLKGHQTVVTDGSTTSLNPTGNPGLATGGSGDVLTGVITGLVCQGLTPLDAARLGVYVHGWAGDLAAAELGQVSLIASDLVDWLPAAFQAANRE